MATGPPRALAAPVLGLCAMMLAGVLATWPMAVSPASRVLGSPAAEAVDHLWGHWLGLRDGPLVIQTSYQNHPYSYEWILGDPANLLFYAPLELIGGPILGFNGVQLACLLLAGLGAAALCAAALPGRANPWVAGVLGVLLPTLSGGLFSGITEAQTIGWACLGLAALHLALERGRWRWFAVAGFAFGLSAWAGPYPTIHGALAAVALGAWHTVRLARQGLGGLARVTIGAAITGVIALVATWPVMATLLWDRPAGLPGTAAISTAVLREPELPQHRMLGGDVLGSFWPLDAPGGAELHVTWLGTALCALVAVGLWQRSRPWALLLPAALMLVLSWGIYLQVGGAVPTVDGRVLMLPAGGLSYGIDFFGRVPRWYRTASIGGVLLCPVAALGIQRLSSWMAARFGRQPSRAARASTAVLVALVALDSIGRHPLPWPRDTFSPELPGGYATLVSADPGAPIVEVPSAAHRNTTPAGDPLLAGGSVRGDPEFLRRRSLLWQALHQLPMGDNLRRSRHPYADRRVTTPLDGLWQAAERGQIDQARQHAEALADLGFRWVVHHPDTSRRPLHHSLEAVLGPADITSGLEPDSPPRPAMYAWRLQPGP